MRNLKYWLMYNAEVSAVNEKLVILADVKHRSVSRKRNVCDNGCLHFTSHISNEAVNDRGNY